MAKEKKLIINADDFGLNKEVNWAILLCFRQGVVKSTSLLVNREGFNHALKIIENNPGLDVGVHLNIFNGKPLTRIKYIVDSRGNFLNNLPGFLFKYYFHKSKIEREIFKEFTRQIEICLSYKISLSHLDTEKHLHVIPEIFEILLRLAEKYKIKYVRLPFEKLIPQLKIDGRQLLKTKLAKFFINKNQLLLNDTSIIKTTNNFYGITLSRNFSLQNIKILFKNLKPGISELSCHPGMTDRGNVYIDSYRLEEYKILTSPEIKEYLIQNKIELANFIENNE